MSLAELEPVVPADVNLKVCLLITKVLADLSTTDFKQGFTTLYVDISY